MMEADKDLFDLFALGAMMKHEQHEFENDREFAERCWRLSLAMVKERNRIFEKIEAGDCPNRDTINPRFPSLVG